MKYTDLKTAGLFLLLSLLFFGKGLQAQPYEGVDTRNGWQMPPYGRLHMLVIFAEINFDSTFGRLDPCKPEGTWRWKAGELPRWKDKLVSPDPKGQGFMTRYFRQASFGKFEVTGDYVDTIVTVNISDIRNPQGRVITQEPFGDRMYRGSVIRKLNEMDKIPMAYGSKIEDFDNWTLRQGAGKAKVQEPNEQYDIVMLVFRNIHVRNLGNHSGFVKNGNIGSINGRQSDMYSIFRTSDVLPQVIMRHEFSHMLYGGNNFHTAAAGVGARTWMPSVGGWSNMSAAGSCSKVWNAWDRERLGWQNPKNKFLISARCGNLQKEINGALSYGQEMCDDVVILRDFVTTGDAIKIELPHLPDSKLPQFLWLENHQRPKGFIDHDKTLLPGLYAYIQAGKEIKKESSAYRGNNNYIYPLVGIGNYDFSYDWEKKSMHLDSKRSNPLTGHHFLMQQPFDQNGDGLIRLTTDVNPRSEYIMAESLSVDGRWMPKDYFSYKKYPVFGTLDVAFRPEKHSKIGISHNPPAVPLYTHASPGGPRKGDNRKIYLNGLSVEVLRQDSAGNLYLKVRWDDFAIKQDLRWCGHVVLKEKLKLRPQKKITLDQGTSPQLNKSVQTLNGEHVFAEPTIMELEAGSNLHLMKRSSILVKKGSGLLIRKGAKVVLDKKAVVRFEKGSYLYIEKGATLVFNGRKAAFDISKRPILGINPILLEYFPDLKEQEGFNR